MLELGRVLNRCVCVWIEYVVFRLGARELRGIHMAASGSDEPYKPMAIDGDAGDPETSVAAIIVEPHEAHLHLDRGLDGHTYVTHMITAERVRLPPGAWDIIFDDESGMGALLNDAGGDDASEDFLLVESLLKKKLYIQVESGDYFVSLGIAGPQCLSSMQSTYREARVKVAFGNIVSSFEVAAYAFQLARAGSQRVFWGINQLYVILKLKSHKGVPGQDTS
jgi:hypothetical protein